MLSKEFTLAPTSPHTVQRENYPLKYYPNLSLAGTGSAVEVARLLNAQAAYSEQSLSQNVVAGAQSSGIGGGNKTDTCVQIWRTPLLAARLSAARRILPVSLLHGVSYPSSRSTFRVLLILYGTDWRGRVVCSVESKDGDSDFLVAFVVVLISPPCWLPFHAQKPCQKEL